MTLSRKLLTPMLGLVLTVLLSACEEEAVRPVVAPELEAMKADVVTYGFEYMLTREGTREAVAFADEAYSYEDSTVVHLRKNVRLVSYDQGTGLPLAEVTADWGRLNLANNGLLARGNAVLVLNADERRIESTELHYAPEQSRIWSDSASVMYSQGRIIEGSGFESDLQFQRPTIRNARTRSR
jgi:LPS export ABC transporter protein LptC